VQVWNFWNLNASFPRREKVLFTSISISLVGHISFSSADLPTVLRIVNPYIENTPHK
jgi:hypothetical protein